MENFKLIQTQELDFFAGMRGVTLETYEVINPHWNKRLAELDDGVHPSDESDFSGFRYYMEHEVDLGAQWVMRPHRYFGEGNYTFQVIRA